MYIVASDQEGPAVVHIIEYLLESKHLNDKYFIYPSILFKYI